MTAQSGHTFDEAFEDKEYWGRLVESAVGGHLLNSIRGTGIELYYWREKDQEVDFVLKKGKALTAIEVKSAKIGAKHSGMDAFKRAFAPNRLLLVGRGGIEIEEFLLTPAEQWI